MPEAQDQSHDNTRALVTNTTPLIALAAATGSLDALRVLYQRVIVPFEVETELCIGGMTCLGVAEFRQATWLERRSRAVSLSPHLSNTLDTGEASVIQIALNENIPLVCIDESVGRRIARLNGLTLTGSIGVLLKAKQAGYEVSIPDALNRMRQHGIWLSATVTAFALSQHH